MRKTKQVSCGKVRIGGGAPVSIQSMTNTDTCNVKATLSQIEALADAGADIVRCTVPSMEAAKAFGVIRSKSPVPLVADIHFDYRLAIAAIESGADKIRINPGNIGSEDKVRAVLEKAKSASIPIRIGVNSGSLEKDLIAKYGGVCAEAMCESAVKAAAYAQSFGFEDIVVSLKCSDVAMNYKAHRLFAAQSDLPLHIGLTESEGIGDTMRVSLTGDPVQEVVLAKQLLKACGIRRTGIDLVSCPTCGRTEVDLESIASSVREGLAPISEKLEKEGRFLRVSVMGCVVNGPGEARSSDFGVACGKGEGVLFKAGEVVKKVPEESIVKELIRLISSQL